MSASYGMAMPGSREQETKELKDFWKAYMRNTPLSGPGGGILAPASPRDKKDGNVHMLSPGLHGPPKICGHTKQPSLLAPTNLNLVPQTRKSKATPSDKTSPPPAAAFSFTGTVFQSQSPSASSSSSRESLSFLDDANNSGSPMRRPSFKRLASQQLESHHIEQALLNRDRDIIGEFEYEDSGSSGPNSRLMSTHSLDVGDNEEALVDDEDDFSDRHHSKRRLFVPTSHSTSHSESGSQPGSASASPVAGAPSNAFLSGLGASPTMMYGSVPKNAQNLMQQALMGGALSVEMGMAEKRRRMSAPMSKVPNECNVFGGGAALKSILVLMTLYRTFFDQNVYY